MSVSHSTYARPVETYYGRSERNSPKMLMQIQETRIALVQLKHLVNILICSLGKIVGKF